MGATMRHLLHIQKRRAGPCSSSEPHSQQGEEVGEAQLARRQLRYEGTPGGWREGARRWGWSDSQRGLVGSSRVSVHLLMTFTTSHGLENCKSMC